MNYRCVVLVIGFCNYGPVLSDHIINKKKKKKMKMTVKLSI